MNIVAGREIAREFVQDALEPLAVATALEPLLDPHSVQRRVLVQHLAEVRDLLGQPGAADRVASMALELASHSAPRVAS